MRTDVLSFESMQVAKGGNSFTVTFFADDKRLERCFFTSIPIVNVPRDVVENIVFHIGLFCLMDLDQVLRPRTIVIKTGMLNPEQVGFYIRARHHYARQHFFEIRASLSTLTTDIRCEGKARARSEAPLNPCRIVAAFGGGKESILSKVLFDAAGIEPLWFMKTRKPFRATLESIANRSGLGSYVSLSEDASDLYRNGYLDKNVRSRTNTGISIYMLTMVLFALERGYGNICLGNERSAMDPFCLWDGHVVNHQFDKAPQYREMMGEYLRKYVASEINLFSIFEGMYEYKLAQMIGRCDFSRFRHMTSCNYLTDEKRWCHHCPKCAWSFAILSYAFGQRRAVEVVGANLFDKPEIYADILDPEKRKPFECVGERSEIWLVLKHCLELRQEGKVLEVFAREILPRVAENLGHYVEKYEQIYQNPALPAVLQGSPLDALLPEIEEVTRFVSRRV